MLHANERNYDDWQTEKLVPVLNEMISFGSKCNYKRLLEINKNMKKTYGVEIFSPTILFFFTDVRRLWKCFAAWYDFIVEDWDLLTVVNIEEKMIE